jgi:hypothetical protein
MSVKAEIKKLERELGVQLGSDVKEFLERPPTVRDKTYRCGRRKIEERFPLRLENGPFDVRTIFDDLRPWSAGRLLPLVADMSGQFVCVQICDPRKGSVFRTRSYFGHLDDKVTFQYLASNISSWIEGLEDTEPITYTRFEALARSGSVEECEKCFETDVLASLDTMGRSLLDHAASFGNRPVLEWCLSRGIGGKYAMSSAIFSKEWEIVEVLFERGFRIDPDDADTLLGVPVRNHQWLYQGEERARFLARLERLAPENAKQPKSRTRR